MHQMSSTPHATPFHEQQSPPSTLVKEDEECSDSFLLPSDPWIGRPIYVISNARSLFRSLFSSANFCVTCFLHILLYLFIFVLMFGDLFPYIPLAVCA